MRALPPRQVLRTDLRRALERLEGLPLRPTSARLVLGALLDEPDAAPGDRLDAKAPVATEVDPGWVLAESSQDRRCDPIALLADRPWWPAPSSRARDALQQLWRHAVAVSLAAGRMAREAGDPEPERVARAGLLHGLGRWSAAALAPDWLARWLEEADPLQRLAFERRTLGTEAQTLGRTLAERWACDPLVAEAAWLHADGAGTLNGCAREPERLALIQRAFALAERTPWALFGTGHTPVASDHRVRVLMAEVQVRCGPAFVAPDVTPHEEHLARANARLLGQVADLRAGQEARDRLLEALAASDPTEGPQAWAERAGLAWCGAPGVARARVVWTGPGARPDGPSRDAPREERPATVVVPLLVRGRPCAEVQLWTVADGARPAEALALRAAWQAWAALIAERIRLDERLDQVVRAHRDRLEHDEARLARLKLDGLAEFAAGAGHELNNPLAVIVGRAQLLLARELDPVAARMLRAILTQAQRAHRIVRDLMYVARPPALRPRFCQPQEIVRSCLRDAKAEADARAIRLEASCGEPGPRVWADPDALRHLTEVLLRNALEATPRGGAIQVSLSSDADALRWTIRDNGRGITETEGMHLFDPFYCGRQAGRGLGLGLPRAARFVAQSGGTLHWHSTPGRGTTFHVHLPLTPPPEPPTAELEPVPLPPTNARPLPTS